MPKSGFGKASLAVKLTASYVIASALVLIGSSGTLYWMLSRNLGKVEQRLLSEKIDFFLEDQSSEPDETVELFNQLSAVSTGRWAQHYWVRILDKTGRTLLESRAMGAWLPPELFPVVQPTGVPRTGKRMVLQGGRVVRLGAAWSTAKGPQQGREIQVALDCSRDAALLNDYWAGLVLVVGLSLVALAGLGVLIVRRGLKPLDDLGREIKALNEERLNHPLDRRDWPVETHAVIEGFNDLSGRLHASFRRLSQFSADLAHELRTPIHNLRLQADVILARPREAEEYRLALENALEEYARLTQMTENLLFLARAENGKQSVSMAEFGVRRHLEAAAGRFKALASGKGVAIEILGDAQVTADPNLFQLILENLLANACAHTPAGGNVTLEARTGPRGAIQVSVADTGTGIPPPLLDQVFDRFSRVDPARVRGDGSGLGLSLVKAAMDLHQGQVKIESDIGNGTKVILQFPVPS